MALTAGARLGPYEITAALGAGGMGEVYKARDTRLDRTVAIKVLPPAIAADTELRERFEREARSLSALNHPHICTLYDVGRQDGLEFLVMEYVAGETLADRLQRGALAAHDALRIATELAEALERAHRAGIVHRDVKPANVMLAPDGVKLLDFGLGKQPEASPIARAAGTASAGLTIAPALTMRGTILGTLHYMAPEQVEGREADARSDIWAFGCVLHEMLAGRRAFEGTTAASLIAAILERQPASIDLTGAPLEPGLRRLLDACLEKNPDERFQSMRDVRREIEWLPHRRATSSEPPARRRPRGLAGMGGAIGLAGATAAAAFAISAAGVFDAEPQPSPPVVFNLTTVSSPAALRGTIFGDESSLPNPAVSPDGARVAFIGWDPAGEAIWIRRLDTRDAAPVPGTHGVRSLFWSPDGTTIGFFAGGKLKTLDVAGQKVEILCDAPLAFGGAWGSDGTILFSPDDRSAVHRVDARGGTPVAVTTLDAARGDEAHRWPQWMPDGRHFVFMPWRDGATRRTLQLGSIDGTPPRPLFESQSGALVAADHFVYVTDMPSRIRAQRYDPRTLQLSGPPFALLTDDNVDYNWMSGNASASVSERTLVYAAGKYRRTRLTWLDRNGRTLETLAEAGAFFDPAISPDGTSVAFERHDRLGGASGDIWTLDLSRGGFSRLTSAPGFETTPIWSPDGSQVAFAWDQGPRPAIYTRRASGTGTEDVLVSPEARSFPTDWSRDGRHVLLMLDGSRTRRDIWRYDVERREATPLLDSPFNESGATFSPDGRWVAYVSDEDQRSQVYVRSFPDGRVRTQISASGGSQPQWRRDGRELFYIAPDNAIMAVAVQASGERLTASAPQPLFTAPVDQRKSIRNQYAVSPDGQRFLVLAVSDADAPQAIVVMNWRTLLRPTTAAVP
jgi:eukaryotic-like serine/threonine-protein kinase